MQVPNIGVNPTVPTYSSKPHPVLSSDISHAELSCSMNLQDEYPKRVEKDFFAARILRIKTIETIAGKNCFFIPNEKVKQILELTSLSENELLIELVSIAKNLALPSISNYKVGAIGLG